MCDEGEKLLMEYVVAKVLKPAEAPAVWDRWLTHIYLCHGCGALFMASIVKPESPAQERN